MFEVGERVICVDDSGCDGAIVRGRSYVVQALVPGGTVIFKHGSTSITICEDTISVGAHLDLTFLAFDYSRHTLKYDFWACYRFRRPQRLETRTALAELVGLVNTTRETVDA